MTIVEQVEEWYATHEPRFASQCSMLRIKTLTPNDQRKGKGVIRIETPATLATITFWNKGDVEVLTVDKVAGKNSVVDDRKLNAEDSIESLLRGYFEKIIGP